MKTDPVLKPPKPVIGQYPVVEQTWLNEAYFKIRILADDIAEKASPGQFVNVRPGQTYDPLLRRPFSIYLADPEEGWIELVIKQVGRGTELLSRLRVGDQIDMLGPLGRGFDIETVETAILAGGGVGLAPLVFLARELSLFPKEIYFFQGFQSKADVCCLEDLAALNIAPVVTTDDGSFGRKGFVTEAVKDFIKDRNVQSGTELFACGPEPMLKEICNIVDFYHLTGQFSLETRMACGIGACMGCAVPAFDGEDYRLVCRDGPVFRNREVLL
ncbi:MAG: dihydroorotate dehydrogenase electron transfer subunit [Calditrichaeota bacterium]|nr:dihydroorotate dehydrogenase electron transfer subunit [Calditrichota bacterium]